MLVSVEVDPDEVLDDMTDDEIESYLRNRSESGSRSFGALDLSEDLNAMERSAEFGRIDEVLRAVEQVIWKRSGRMVSLDQQMRRVA